jgi:hypothetical protein
MFRRYFWQQTSTPCTGVIAMTQLLERLRPRKKVFKADILSRFGETICLPELSIPPVVRERPVAAPAVEERRAWDEDPERWDGLS